MTKKKKTFSLCIGAYNRPRMKSCRELDRKGFQDFGKRGRVQ